MKLYTYVLCSLYVFQFWRNWRRVLLGYNCLTGVRTVQVKQLRNTTVSIILFWNVLIGNTLFISKSTIRLKTFYLHLFILKCTLCRKQYPNNIQKCPNSIKTISKQYQTISKQYPTTSNNIQTITKQYTNNIQTISNNIQTISDNIQIISKQYPTISKLSNNIQTITKQYTNNIQTISNNIQTISNNIQTIQQYPNDNQTIHKQYPNNIQQYPNNIQTISNNIQTLTKKRNLKMLSLSLHHCAQARSNWLYLSPGFMLWRALTNQTLYIDLSILGLPKLVC